MDNQNNSIKIGFIGVGAPKCATTWIYKCLDEHPQICMGRPKEIHFFNKDHGFDNPDVEWRYPKGMNYYFSHFSHCPKDAVIGEFSSKYMYDKNSAELIKKHLPDVKIIMSLRNPADRTFSQYNHTMSKTPGYFKNFESALKDEPELIEKSKYSEQIKRFLNFFPKENILILIYEEIEKNPVKFIQSIYKFLNVNDDFVPNSALIKINVSKARYSKSNKQAKLIIFRVYNFLKRIPVISQLVAFVKSRGADVKIIKSIDKKTLKDKKTPALNPEMREKLNKVFSEDINETEKLLDRRIDAWHN